MRLYAINELQDALFEALDNNPSEAEFVKKYITNLSAMLARNPAYYRYLGPYWWPIKRILLNHDMPGGDDFIDAEWLGKVTLPTNALNCIAGWAMQETRIGSGEMPTNSVMLEDGDGNVDECVVVDPFLEELIKNPI